MARQSHKEAGSTPNRQHTLKDGAPEKREFARLVYPPAKRPTLKVGENELEIIDISEKGVRLLNNNQVNLDKSIYGEALLLSGRSINVDGEVAWNNNNEVGLLMALIPSSIIAEERRILSSNKFLNGVRLKPKTLGSGRRPKIDAPRGEQADQTTLSTNGH